MYSKAELEAKAHIELINIAKELGIARATRLDAQDLIYKIIGLQSENPKAITKEQEQQKSQEQQPRQQQAHAFDAGHGNYLAFSRQGAKNFSMNQ